jgi:hypothetical protein
MKGVFLGTACVTTYLTYLPENILPEENNERRLE